MESWQESFVLQVHHTTIPLCRTDNPHANDTLLKSLPFVFPHVEESANVCAHPHRFLSQCIVQQYVFAAGSVQQCAHNTSTGGCSALNITHMDAATSTCAKPWDIGGTCTFVCDYGYIPSGSVMTCIGTEALPMSVVSATCTSCRTAKGQPKFWDPAFCACNTPTVCNSDETDNAAAILLRNVVDTATTNTATTVFVASNRGTKLYTFMVPMQYG